MTDDEAPPTPPRAAFSTRQVAEFLQLSATTVRRLGDEGAFERLPGLRVNRYTAVSVQAYLQGRKKGE